MHAVNVTATSRDYQTISPSMIDLSVLPTVADDTPVLFLKKLSRCPSSRYSSSGRRYHDPVEVSESVDRVCAKSTVVLSGIDVPCV